MGNDKHYVQYLDEENARLKSELAATRSALRQLREALSDAAEMLAIASRFALNVGEDISSRSFAAASDEARRVLVSDVSTQETK